MIPIKSQVKVLLRNGFKWVDIIVPSGENAQVTSANSASSHSHSSPVSWECPTTVGWSVAKDLQCTEHDLLFHSLVPFVHAVTFLSSLSGLSFKTSIRDLSLLNSLLGPPQPQCDWEPPLSVVPFATLQGCGWYGIFGGLGAMPDTEYSWTPASAIGPGTGTGVAESRRMQGW